MKVTGAASSSQSSHWFPGHPQGSSATFLPPPQLLEEKLRFVLRNLPTALGLNLLLAVALALSVLDAAKPWPGLAWVLANGLLATAGLVAARIWSAQPQPWQHLSLLRIGLAVGAFLQGTLWGLAVALPSPAQFMPLPMLVTVLITVLSAVTCGGILLLFPLHSAYLSFLLPAVLPLSLKLLGGGTLGFRMLGVSGLVYAVTMAVVSARLNRWMSSTLETSQDKEILTRDLLQANTALQDYRNELEATIWARTLALRESNLNLQKEISEKETARQKATHAEARYRTLFEEMGDGYLRLGEREEIHYANPAAEKIFGVGPGGLAGCPLDAFLVSGQPREEHPAEEPGDGSGALTPLREILRPDGASRWIRIRFSPVLDAQGVFKGTTALFQDCTDLRRNEVALAKAQHLESLRAVAGGVAHAFNNLMGTIMGNLSLAQMSAPPESLVIPYLENLEAAAHRSVDLTRQMLAFSGTDHSCTSPMNLSRAVADFTELLRAGIREEAILRLELAQELPAIQGSPSEIHRILLNLVANASEALGGQAGEIRIRTRTLHLDAAACERLSRILPAEPGPHVALDISDTGCGMPPEVQEQVFDPFFTTKGPGRGLGLSSTLGLLRSLQGSLEMESRLGEGTRFTLCFPLMPAPAPACGQIPPGVARPFAGKVLLVDDDPCLLETNAAMLAAMGLEVLTARDGLEALERYQEQPREIGLILLDLAMPRMDGHHAYRALRELDPDLPVILISGDDPQESELPQEGSNRPFLLRKPYGFKLMKSSVEDFLFTRGLSLPAV